MKVFLLSDMVVHELVSMQLEGKWLTAEQFSESARLWISRHAPKHQLSELFVRTLEREALQIAERLMKDGVVIAKGSPLRRLFLDIPVVNYADPLSASALAASLEVCRNKLCDCGPHSAGKDLAAQLATGGLSCPAVLRSLICTADTPQPEESAGEQGCTGRCGKAGKK
ncbi:hypothetical protein [Paraburkholderia diazotrophica]|uniref:Uncharacterized protein n=1 Tax=Paraburkholderia diazotrophica TaxID=667676 RepID=A0A1H7B4P5_9BURK|nr:hypothetical protein [Paraburkholderia diazotrophica]SEJ72428.1 hypothetical protein SAMN05192539_1016121 [Paraburkholderia diazotrophica]